MARDGVACIGVARNYASAAVRNRRVVTLDPKFSLTVQGAMVNAMRGMVLEPAFSCPEYAERCTYENISTLGVCRDINEIEVYCVPVRPSLDKDCIVDIDEEHSLIGHVGTSGSLNPRITTANATFMNDKYSSLLTYFLIQQGDVTPPIKVWEEYVPTGYKAIRCRWYFCRQTYYGVEASAVDNITFDSLQEEELKEVYGKESGEWHGEMVTDSTAWRSWVFPG